VGQCGRGIGPFPSPNTKMCISHVCSIKKIVVNMHSDMPFIKKKFPNILGWTHTLSPDAFMLVYIVKT
jgi:hypothetical protein